MWIFHFREDPDQKRGGRTKGRNNKKWVCLVLGRKGRYCAWAGKSDMDEGLSGFCLKGGAKCGRWNPTTEQVKVLTDLFRSGLRTPSTDQIQKISSHLSFYGKIESKNVFYWFQNHKARERQKRRRISIPHHDTNHFLIPPSKYHGGDEIGLHEGEVGMEKERVVETLQLFPMKSGCEEGEKVWWRARKEIMNETFSYALGKDYPPLELRLSSF